MDTISAKLMGSCLRDFNSPNVMCMDITLALSGLKFTPACELQIIRAVDKGVVMMIWEVGYASICRIRFSRRVLALVSGILKIHSWNSK